MGRALFGLTLVMLAFCGSAASAGADTVHVDRADYFTNYNGSFVSIEAHADSGASVLTAHVSGAADKALQPYSDAGVYLEHRLLMRVPSRPADVSVTSDGGGSDTLAIRDWGASAPSKPAGYLEDFSTGYLDPRQVSTKVSALAAEFPGLASQINLPYQTDGYQRPAQAVLGISPAYAGATGDLDATNATRAVVVTSKAMGQNGGNNIDVALTDPGTASQSLSVSTAGSSIVVHLATDSTGSVTTTAAQVVAALKADSSAAALVTASTYNGNAGNGVVGPQPAQALSDFLKAPGGYPRGPQAVSLLRIGSHRDGSRPGVLIFAQEDGSDWVSPLAALELTERLLRNYGSDPATTALLDGLDIFIVPVVNPDGAAYSFYDSAAQSKDMTPCLAAPGNRTDPLARNTWGVSVGNNFSIGSLFDGYAGASTSCASNVFAGVAEMATPEARDVDWVAQTFTNIKMAVDVRGSGGYLTWSPGAYTDNSSRTTLPRPQPVLTAWSEQVAESVAGALEAGRQSVMLPQRVGALTDVRPSQAGNAIDQMTYGRDLLGFTVNPGIDRFSGSGDPSLTPVGSQPSFATEGHAEVLESADGLTRFLDAARAYAQDTTPPDVELPAHGPSKPGLKVSFNSDEPATIRYTLDGTTPDGSSPVWVPTRPRQRAADPLTISTSTTVKWIASDLKGNTSAVKSVHYDIDGDAPLSSASVLPAPVDGWMPIAIVTLSASDSFGVDAIDYKLDDGPSASYGDPITVATDGPHTVTFHAVDVAGNEEQERTVSFSVDRTAPTTAASADAGTVTLVATDSGSGVAGTEYRLDGGALQPYGGPLSVSRDVAHTVEYRSRDKVGNVEGLQSLSLPAERPGLVAPPLGPPLPAASGKPVLQITRTTIPKLLRSGLRLRAVHFKPGKVTVALRLGKKTLGSVRLAVPASGSARAVVRVRPAARRLLQKRRRVTLIVVAGKLQRSVTLKR